MKRFCILLALVLLLCGCSGQETPPTTDAAPVATTVPEVTLPPETLPVTQPTEPPATLMDNRVFIGEQSHVWYVDCTAAEDFSYPALYTVNGNLLLTENNYYDEYCDLRLKLVDLDNGKELGMQEIPCSGYCSVYTSDTAVALCDAGAGTVFIFDANLELVKEYTLEMEQAEWLIAPDLTTLYIFGWESGLERLDLETMQRETILDAYSTVVMDRENDTIFFEYLNKEDLLSYHCDLDAATGDLSVVTVDAAIGWIDKCGDYMLVSDYNKWALKHLISPISHNRVYSESSAFELLQPKAHVYVLSTEGSEMSIYTPSGQFLSRCILPDGMDYYVTSLLWSEQWNGYFFVIQDETEAGRLVFWDLQIPMDGDNLILQTDTGEIPGGIATAQELYDRAAALSEKYGLDIRIADQCKLDYDEFYSYAVTDSYQLTNALDTLETALADYPEGFFRQLLFNDLRSIRIELIGGLQRKNWPEDAAYTSFSAFAQERGDHYLIVADVNTTYTETYFHEFSHIIDRRLDFDGIHRPDALFSEDRWLELQPAGFGYSYSYTEVPYDAEDYRYAFADDYAMTYPTEDRARIMEYAMIGWHWVFMDSDVLTEKLNYYCQCIRDSFDDTGWPEVTVWEQALTSE